MDDSKYIKVLEELVSALYEIDINKRTVKVNNHQFLAGKTFKNSHSDIMEAVARAQYSYITSK